MGLNLNSTGISYPWSMSVDPSGKPLAGTVGTTNPNGTALFVQGVTGGVPIPTTITGQLPGFASTPTVNIGTAPSIAVTGTFFQATQPISGSIGNTGFNALQGNAANSLTNPFFMSPATGASFNVVCTSGCTGGGSGGGTSSNFNSAFPAAGTAIGVSNGTNMVALTLGQAVAGLSLPVVLPTAQITALTPPTSVGISGLLPAFAATPTFNIGTAPTIAVTGTFFQATQPISGTVTANAGTNLNTSALALETGGNLASINTKTPALGQALAASSVPVVLTAIQQAALTPPAAITNFALETGGNLATVVTNTGRIPAQGQALAAASLPVVLTAAQITTLTPLSTVTVTQGTGTNLHIVCDSGCAGSGGTSATFGATFPTLGTPVGFSQGGNFVAATGTSGNLNVQCANCTGSGASAADEASFTAGTSIFAPAGGVAVATGSPLSITAGLQGLFAMTVNRAMWSNLRTSAGTEAGTAATPFQVSLANTAANSTALLVTGTGGTFPITAASLPLPTGAATQTTLASVLTALGSPFQAGGSIGNTTFAATQATASALNATVVGTGTFAMQLTGATNNINNIAGTISLPTGAATAALQTTGNTALTTINSTLGTPMQQTGGSIAPSSLAAWGLVASTQNSATPTNAQLADCQFNTSPTTVTSGNVTPIQCTNTGAINVAIVSGAGSGGTASSFAATFPTTGTAVGAEFLTSPPTLTSGQMASLQLTSAGSLHTTVDNTTALGSAVSASSSPVVIASDQAAVAIKAASGAFSSGALASGSISAGAVAAGAYVSGSVLSGAYASGAIVDLTNMQTPVAPNTATATKGILIGGQFNTTQETLTNGQQGGVALSARGAQFVAVGADGFAVTNAGTFATQSAITAASSSISSGAFASGSISSGAFASGSISSGAAVSGAFVAGAIADLAHGQGTMAASVPVAIASNQSSIPVSTANGASVAVGSTTDAPCTLPATTTACSEVAVQKAIANASNSPMPLGSATGGWNRTLFAGLSTTVKSVKASAGQLAKLYCDNPNTTAIYVETFDTAGTVTLGTTAPTAAYYIPPTNAAGFSLSLVGDQYTAGIQIAAVTSENGSTAPATPGNCNVSWN
jgi:hypothetical protein